MTTTEPTIQELVTQLVDARLLFAQARSSLSAIEYQLQRRMELDGATRLSVSGYAVSLKPGKPSYDGAVLVPLLERVPEALLINAYIPEHTTTVPAKWDGRGLATIAKTSTANRELIEQATIRSHSTIDVEKETR